jgi:hypothetical protein
MHNNIESPNIAPRMESVRRTLVPLLQLFPIVPGRRQRIQDFVSLCYQYRMWYAITQGWEVGDQSLATSRRVEIHNQIMAIVAKLFQLPDARKRYGGPPPDRVEVRAMILGHHEQYKRKKTNQAAHS